MVTSNKLPDKKVFKMSDQNSNAVVPQRTLLGEVNAHLTCHLCRGYYIDATTIVECLHAFCRSCIIKHLQVKSYCPVCEMMINSAKPNIKPDKALQDIVYKLVPGLFQKEMERRQQFYSSRPGPAASATPEQRGEDTERIIFSPEDVISFSLEYADITDTDSISSKSSDGNEQQIPTAVPRRYLQCPAVVNISHLKKFLSVKFDIDSTQYSIDILYKRVPLPDYYTLMDIAYIYNWKRNKPMRFIYQIIDYIAIRNRYGLFDINRKGSHFRERKWSPTPTDDANACSPAPHLREQGSEASSGTDSPMPDDNGKKCSSSAKKQELQDNNNINKDQIKSSVCKNNDDDVEKSQFLNSFELTAKSSAPGKSPVKTQSSDIESVKMGDTKKDNVKSPTKAVVVSSPVLDEGGMKRKPTTPPTSPEVKKLKLDSEKSNLMSTPNKGVHGFTVKPSDIINKPLEQCNLIKDSATASGIGSQMPQPSKEVQNSSSPLKQQLAESNTALKRPVPGTQNLPSPKRKVQDNAMSSGNQTLEQKSVSPLKIQLPKPELQPTVSKSAEQPKPVIKRMPELKSGVPSNAMNQNKNPVVRMDFLANNCDPTMDRSKIMSQVKTALAAQGVGQGTGQGSGHPLKSIFDSCKINIPSSLSITLTDQKQEPRPENNATADPKKPLINKINAIGGSNNINMHKVPSPPVHNYIEILKLPDTEHPKKPLNKADPQNPQLQNKKIDNIPPQKPSGNNKSESTTTTSSAKGPMPSLKPIAETKLMKQSGMFSMTSPYQQKYIQSLEQSEKSKLPKNKMQVPKLMPATSKILSAANKDGAGSNKVIPTTNVLETKTPRSDVLDLSTSHGVQSQLGPQQTKALETMQTIANLAKKQNLSNKVVPISLQQSSQYPGMLNRTVSTEASALRIPMTSQVTSQVKADKSKLLNTNPTGMSRQEMIKPNPMRQLNTSSSTSTLSSSYQSAQTQNSANSAQPSPRQTRSPSSSPKLVIAEDKHTGNINESNVNQSNQISSTQVCAPKTNSPKPLAGPSKSVPMKPNPKVVSSGIRQPITPTMKPVPPMGSASDILLQPQLLLQPQFLRHHMEWLKNQQVRNYEEIVKTMNFHQNQKDFNKDNKQ